MNPALLLLQLRGRRRGEDHQNKIKSCPVSVGKTLSSDSRRMADVKGKKRMCDGLYCVERKNRPSDRPAARNATCLLTVRPSEYIILTTVGGVLTTTNRQFLGRVSRDLSLPCWAHNKPAADTTPLFCRVPTFVSVFFYLLLELWHCCTAQRDKVLWRRNK